MTAAMAPRPPNAAGPLLADGDARDAVEHDLDRNLFVEAGAGTGKTTALVKRVVRLFATGRVTEPSRLAAITFTEAAAAELRDRVRTALERAAAPGGLTDTTERARCRAAAGAIDEAVITTLHGFAQRILAEHPLAAGLPPAFEVDEGIPAELELVERWSAFADELLGDEGLRADLELGFTLGLSLGRLAEVARLAHDRWDRLSTVADAADPGPVPQPDPSAVLVPLRAAVARAEAHAEIDDRLVQLVLGDVAGVLDCYDEAIATGDEREVLRALAAWPVPRRGGYGSKAVWGVEPKAEVHALLEQAADERAALLGRVRTHVLTRIVPRIARMTLDWAAQRRRAGRLHYHDLLVLARDLLWSDAGVREALARRFAVLLVDEFQDTDPIQVELVVALAAADPTRLPARWDDVELAPGRVLVVGDPKQSIYGFRGADITLWNRTRDRFGDGVVHLRQNFRSVPSILAWVNDVFGALIGAGDGDVQPPYTALEPTRATLDAEPAVVTLGGPAEHGLNASEVRLREAGEIAAAIRALRTAGAGIDDGDGGRRALRYDDVAILVPTRAPLGPIERALDDADIPYRVESRSLVWRTDVVREVLSLLTAVEDPADEVAVVATLRSPAFACTDPELLEWRRAGGRWDPTRSRPDEVADDHPVAQALARLRRWHDERWWVPVDALLADIVRDRRLIELTFAQRRPRDHWRRLRFVLDQARAFVESGGSSLAQFLAWARLQVEGGAAAVEAVVPEPDDNAVRILTVHGSKGLEFPVVVLAGLATGAPPGGTSVIWHDDGPEISFSVPGGGARFQTAGWATARTGAQRLEETEAVRLLYVAATRAREQLLVSLHHPSMRADKSHAALLHRLCHSCAPTWRPAVLDAEPTLLDVPSGDGPPPRTSAERAAWRAGHRAAMTAAARPWSVAPTALAGHLDDELDDDALDDSGEPRPPVEGRVDVEAAEPSADADGGRRGGTAVGRAVHAILQHVDLDAAASADVERLAGRESALEGMSSQADIGTVAELAASALSSTAVAEARAGRRHWREVPVVAPVGDRLVEGYVDLLYEDAEGRLVVVDWKTDRARTEAEVDAAVERYRLQGAGYAVAVEQATGRPVERVTFVFCRTGGEPAVERQVGGADLAAAVVEARRRLREE
jgi:ATP-dependent helicase/nuclease subunit A